MQPIIRTSWVRPKTPGTLVAGPSATIPDQTLSVREIVRRFASGLPVGGARVPMYDEDEEGEPLDMPDYRTMDLSEIHDHQQSVRDEVLQIQNKYKSEQDKSAFKKMRDDIIAKHEKSKAPEAPKTEKGS